MDPKMYDKNNFIYNQDVSAQISILISSTMTRFISSRIRLQTCNLYVFKKRV